MSLKLENYFERIGYRGPTPPTLETLRSLCRQHVSTIPFENLDVLLGRGISLEDAAVDAKLIDARRGGYCFEQNTLFLRVLLELGFHARPISARVRVGRPRDFTPARTHVFVRLELDGESWLADVGVGGLSPTAPLRLIENVEQETPHEKRRLIREGGKWFHQAWLTDAWADVCEFTLEEMPPIDREVANWFTSAHPQSHFRNRLLVARALEDAGRVTLLNRELTVRTRNGVTTTVLQTPDELLATLSRHFGLEFPAGTRFDCSALDFQS
ncbi:MAG: arylamine N-acetyltransferase [Archangium sp.]